MSEEQKTIWGFDLGTTSIGWAIIDADTNLPIAANARMIEAGGDTSPAAERREKRHARRQKERRTMRKNTMIKLLQAKGMFPKASFKERKAIHLNEDLKAFFVMNPYKLRKEALERRLEKNELGRVLYHLAQRRGFPFDEYFDNEETKNMGDAKEAEKLGLIAIPDTEALMAGSTLGKSLYQHQLEHSNPAEAPSLRRRYTKRTWYKEEFKEIWKYQSGEDPAFLTPEFKKKVHHILFFQRGPKSQAHLKARCLFEPDRPVAPKASIYFERYRFYQTLNNLKVDGEPLNQDQRKTLEAKSMYRDKDHTIEEIAKILGVEIRNLNYKHDQKLPACTATNSLRNIFGKKAWDALELEEQHLRLESIRDPKALEKKIKAWNLSEEKSKSLRTLHGKLSKQYASLCHKVIKAALPYLEKGFLYDFALPLASLKKVFKRANRPFSEEVVDNILAEIPGLEPSKPKESRYGHYYSAESPIEKLKKHLQKEYQISEEALKGLYHHSDHFTKEQCDEIPYEKVPDLRNPTVNRVLYELRRLGNDLLKRYGRPDTIRLEMVRDLKKSKDQKKKIDEKNKENKKLNDDAKALLLGRGVPATRDNIRKVQLWWEAGRFDGKRKEESICIYSERQIRFPQLFDGSYQLEHIVPKEISHDNTYYNLTLCPTDENRKKGKRTPFQYLGSQEKWKAVKERAKAVFSIYKYNHFVNEKEPDIGRKESQISDTSYIARESRKLLYTICGRVETTKGGITALMRHHWGLNSLLAPKIPSEHFKSLDEGTYFLAVDKEGNLVPDTIMPDPIGSLKDDDKEAYKAWRKEYNARVRNIKKELEKKLKKKGQGQILYGEVRNESGSKRFFAGKNRNDHRHHLLDAIVVSLASSRYTQYCNRLSAEGLEGLRKKIEVNDRGYFLIEAPHPDFRQKVKKIIDEALVVYRQKNRHYQKRVQHLVDGRKRYHDVVRGQLHEATYYGKRGEAYTIRKETRGLTKEQIAKIFNLGTRQDVEDWYKEKRTRFPHQQNNPSLLPIKRVRLQKTIGNAVQLDHGMNPNQWVDPKNNYITAIYQDDAGGWHESIISLWEAVNRKKQGKKKGLPIVPKKNDAGHAIHFTLRRFDYFLLGLAPEVVEAVKALPWEDLDSESRALLHKHLYRVRSISSKNYFFDHHRYINGIVWERVRSPDKFKELTPVKVRLNRLGEITQYKVL